MKPPSQPQPLNFWSSLPFFAVPALGVVLSVYGLLPALRARDFSEYTSYCWALLVPLILMLAAALVAYRLEGRPFTWQALRERFRLQPLTRQDWLWMVAVGLLLLGAYALLSGATRVLVHRGWIPLPDYIPAMIDPRQTLSVATLLGLLGEQVPGRWDQVLLTLALLFFNIIGEEFWWRGYILPRQELAWGNRTWVLHGILWTLFHAFKYWDWLALLPGCLGIALMAQRRNNTVPGIIVHLVVNGSSAIGIVLLLLTGGPP